MAAAQKGAISFGLVHIPVELHTAMLDTDVHFNQLVPVPGSDEMSRIKYKKVCAATGREVRSDEIVKGYQYDKDRYVVVSDAELEALKTEKDRNITIVQFTDLHAIPPMLFNRAYHVLPQKGGEKPFELLRQAMIRENQAAVARTVIGSTERMVVILPREDGVVLQTMHFESDVRQLPKPLPQVDLSAEEMDLAVHLLKAMAKPFEAKDFHDQYQEKVRALIEDKIKGQDTVKDKAMDPAMTVASLQEALRQSLAKQGVKEVKRPKAKKVKFGKAS